MRLTWNVHAVSHVRWGERTLVVNRTLEIDPAALSEALLADQRLANVVLELVQPGDSCRIQQVWDIVEPRARLDSGGANFPGALGPVQSVGSGTTRVLRGVAATILDPTSPVPGHVIDMDHAGFPDHAPGEATPYAGVAHVVIVPTFAGGLTVDEQQHALRVAVLRAATFLAESAEVGAPDREEVFDLAPVDPALKLPRVAYVYQLHSHQIPTVAGEPVLYGDNVRYLLPTVIHPNEILDGAVVRSYFHLNMETYGIQNHAVIRDLYRRHGQSLEFTGVVVYVANQLAEERQRATLMGSNLVKYALRADGAVFTKSIGGAPNMDMALVANRCEELGVRTSLILGDMGTSSEDSTLFNFASLDAIVSTGGSGFSAILGPVKRVVGANGELVGGETVSVGAGRVAGMVDQLGGSHLTLARF
jgi:sarcosine reductase